MNRIPGCPLCETPGGIIVWRGPRFRVVRSEEPGFPAFYRVVWQDHVVEFSDLSADDRHLCIDVVTVVEQVLRSQLRPEKINLATLGNMVAHLHWHVVARFEDDSHFPGSVWAPALRERNQAHEAALLRRMPAVDAAIAARLTDAARAGGDAWLA